MNIPCRVLLTNVLIREPLESPHAGFDGIYVKQSFQENILHVFFLIG